jgi:hypothetical protein
MVVVLAAASALIVTCEPVSKVVPAVGLTTLIESDGLTVTRATSDVVVAPRLSVATAVML